MKEQNPFSYSKVEDSTGFLLWQVHNYWQREIKKALKPLEITHTQFVILANTQWLNIHQDIVTQIDIARHANTDIMMTSNVLRTLEKKNLIKRRNHKTDTRAKVVELSPKGKDILGIAVKKVESFDRIFFKKVDELNHFNSDLLRLIKQEE